MMEGKGISHLLSENNLSAYFAHSHDGVFLLNECMELVYANKTMQEWIGSQDNEAQHINLIDFIAFGESKILFIQNTQIAFEGAPCKFECVLHHSEQHAAKWLEISLQRSPNGQLLGIARDIAGHKQEVERLVSKTNQDELTGLLNRNEFMRTLQDVITPTPGCEHVLLMIELEHFGIINDMCGLAAGDEVLCGIAELLRRIQRKQVVVARMGGKKFALLCMGCNMDTAYGKACEIRDAISSYKFEYNNNKFDLGVSIGFTAMRPDTNNSRLSLLSEADSACHYARNMGHNRIHAYTTDGNKAYRQHESEWISRISHAFENERFQLFYQNIQQIENGLESDEHHEILIRMLDDNGEFVTPDEFIPAAEKFNLMPLIDRWVIRTVFARNAQLWRNAFRLKAKNANAPMSLCCINISGSSLNDNYFPEFLRDQVALHQLPPQAVCFEITETVAVNDLEKASCLIKTLRAQGFRFALDDFGKGMSSFSYLRSLPVDFLKIDGSLVQNIDNNKIDLCMVEAINRIAQEMGIKTIAEYVKNQTVVDMLQALGVNYVQGYGIHQPEPLL